LNELFVGDCPGRQGGPEDDELSPDSNFLLFESVVVGSPEVEAACTVVGTTPVPEEA